MKDKQTIYRIRHGSHLYGTSTLNSDLDYKEVHLPAGRSIVLQSAKSAVVTGPQKEEGAKNQAGDVDTQSFAVHKLFDMLISGDIIGMEMIFTPKQNIEFILPQYELILENKEIFYSRKVDGYVGYCRQQANKYGIRGSRVATARAACEMLEKYKGNSNAKLSEIEFELTSFAAMNEHSSIIPILNKGTGQMMNHFECCGRKAPFTITIKEAYNIYKRVFDEYGDRAKQAESNEGIDWKALSHAIRVGHQAIELLKYKQITFPRPDARYLLDIKLGKIPYKSIAEELDILLTSVVDASTSSTLPEKVDRTKVDELLLELYRNQVV